MKLPGAEAVVIGGGVIGTSIAYQLAKRGIETALFEKSGLGSGTSSSCVMGIHLQTKTPGAKLAFAQQSLAIYRILEDELVCDLEFVNEGAMIVAETPEEAQYIEKKVADLRACGLEVYYLNGEEARQRQPALDRHIVGSSYCPDDSSVDPLRLVPALGAAAERLGARVYTYCPVIGLEVHGDQPVEVSTVEGAIEADVVVNAAGLWAPKIAGMVGLDLPIIPRQGQMFVTEPAPRFVKGTVLAAKYLMSKKMPPEDEANKQSTLSAGVVASQTRRGNLLVGSTRQFAGFDRRVGYEALRRLMHDTVQLLPTSRHLHVIRTYAGLRPATPDGLPILERSSNFSSFYTAAGHEGDGIALSPITGVRMAQLITGEIEESVLAPFASSRFKD